MAQGTFYFSHDYNTRTDAKIKKLLLKHGMAGYGLFWAIIEDLYNNSNALPLDYECIAFDLRSDEVTVKSILNDFDLFVLNETTFGSSSVQKRLQEREDKSAKARESAIKRWETDATAERPQSDSNAIKERKGKDTKPKEDKNKDKPKGGDVEEIEVKIVFPFPSVLFCTAWADWKEYKWEQHKFKYKSSKSEQAALNSLEKMADSIEGRAIEIINYSMGQGYQGLFAPKNFATQQNPIGFQPSGSQPPKRFSIAAAIKIQEERK